MTPKRKKAEIKLGREPNDEEKWRDHQSPSPLGGEGTELARKGIEDLKGEPLEVARSL